MAEARKRFGSRFRAVLQAVMRSHWLGAAGHRFRRTLEVVSDFTKEQVRPEERVKEAPELAWKAVQGLASDKHAKASLDYAKEESERIDIAHKKELFPTKQRQEKAAADKLEAEARTARINELRARIDLIKELREIGVVPQQDDQRNIRIMNAPAGFDWDELLSRGLLDPSEQAVISQVEDVLMPEIGDGTEMTVLRLLKRPGDAVTQNEPIVEISVSSAGSLVPCPLSGTLVELLVIEGQHVRHDQIIARIRPC